MIMLTCYRFTCWLCIYFLRSCFVCSHVAWQATCPRFHIPHLLFELLSTFCTTLLFSCYSVLNPDDPLPAGKDTIPPCICNVAGISDSITNICESSLRSITRNCRSWPLPAAKARKARPILSPELDPVSYLGDKMSQHPLSMESQGGIPRPIHIALADIDAVKAATIAKK
jgi:hypothetical protein